MRDLIQQFLRRDVQRWWLCPVCDLTWMARCGSRFQKVSWVRALQFFDLHRSLRTIIGSAEGRSMSRMCRQSSADEQRDRRGRAIASDIPKSKRVQDRLRRHPVHSRTGCPRRLSETKRSGQAARAQACAGAPAVTLRGIEKACT